MDSRDVRRRRPICQHALKSLPGGKRGINGAQICQCGQWWPRSPIWEDNGAVPDPDKIVKMQIAPIRLPGRNRQGLPPVPPRICCLKVTKRNAVS
jgi:hypothetical protein